MAVRSSVAKKVIFMALVCMTVLREREAEAAAVTCGSVVSTLKPCIQFLKGSGGPPPGPCCGAVRTLKNTVQTTTDRRTACQCMKNAAAKISGFNYGVASRLAGQCGVSIPYIFSPTLNCNTVQ